MQLANRKATFRANAQLVPWGYERKRSPWWMDTFVFLCSIFHKFLLSMFSSSGIISSTSSKITSQTSRCGAGSWQCLIYRKFIGNYLAHKLWSLSAEGKSPSVLSWKSQLWQEQQRHVQGCSLGQTFLMQNVKNGLILLFACFDPLFFVKE